MNLRDLPDMSSAYKQVQEKNDGNLANNAPPYDKVTRRDVITGALGKDEMGGKRKKHDCAKKVNYKKEEFDVIPEMHTMLEDGTVTHYDITNGEYIYENVPVEELEILISEKHEHFDNYAKNAEMLEGVRDEDPEKGTKERKARLEKKRGMKLDDHPQYKKEEVEDIEEGKYSGSKSHIQRDGTASAPERTAAERRKDRRILAGYGKGGMQDAIERAKKERDERRAARKEAFAFSLAELEELVLHQEEIDALTDEQLIDFFVEAIQELAVDEEDLLEICEELESVELLDEASDKYYDSAVKASKDAAKKLKGSRMERMKGAAKKAASAVKAGVKGAAKKAIGAGARAAGHAKGEFEASRIKSKRAAMSRPDKKKEAPKKDSDDDGTGGKLDALLKDTRGTSSSSSSSGGGGERDAGSEARERLKSKKKGPGLLRRLGSAVKSGLKKAVGKTARAVSSGSDKLAKRMNEDYDKIAHLHESGLFSIEEIENVIEEGYKPIDKKKENAMYRRAGNLARTSLSSKGKKKEDAQNKSAKIVSAISSQKERERFDKMADVDARK